MDPWLHDPDKILLLHHENGLKIGSSLARTYTKMEEHDPSDMNRAREIASTIDPIPVGILYQNDSVPCYEDIRRNSQLRTASLVQKGLEHELDKFTVWQEGAAPGR
jgi:2-oxoglutarate ferredoxin oxidoreductase subunit beta